MVQLVVRIIQRLLLILFITNLPAIASAQTVSATMQLSMNVIQACSVSFGNNFSGDRDRDNKNIRCGQDDVHRISYHRENSREHTDIEHDRAELERSYFEKEHDQTELEGHDDLELVTIEF